MNLENESYLSHYRRREQLAGLDRKWQIVEWERAQQKRPFFPKIHSWLHLMAQVRKIRIQVSFEISEPCPEGIAQ
jgi:hypothetical protein